MLLNDELISYIRFLKNEQYWTNKPNFNQENNTIEGLFDVEALQHILTESRIPLNCFRMVDNGTMLHHSKFSRTIYVGEKPAAKVLDGKKVADGLKNNFSLILSSLEEFWPPLTKLCKELTKELGTRVSSFAVVSPPYATGFVPHIDSTEQIVIQCSGEKKWNVYEIPSNFRKGQEVDPNQLGLKTFDGTLSKNNFLYLPYGVPHNAFASEELSIHVTLTIEPIRINEWVLKSVNEILKDKSLNQLTLPPKYNECSNSEKKIDDVYKYVANKLLEKRNLL
ncbi:JmjC domain-containing protein [Alkalicoccobacillus murimartini]|uniref:Ribosomal protein L16 Arg81 hydroxylase n=1 Tax=Alkalicoccobacillus murimartini TaxID=171685 RepID=A0ABT9YFN3_9BACI|nr:cupin domain-containing protein [Alkalicoccobacillus murimartini]MDQ0206630.1 ribosomal protein L16 Arg81 hydroxylase [Alkalicoccobacillus murimartini]